MKRRASDCLSCHSLCIFFSSRLLSIYMSFSFAFIPFSSLVQSNKIKTLTSLAKYPNSERCQQSVLYSNVIFQFESDQGVRDRASWELLFMVWQLATSLHIFTQKHDAWVYGNDSRWNDLHAHVTKLFKVNTYYQLKKPVDKHISLPLRLCL